MVSCKKRTFASSQASLDGSRDIDIDATSLPPIMAQGSCLDLQRVLRNRHNANGGGSSQNGAVVSTEPPGYFKVLSGRQSISRVLGMPPTYR